MIKTNNKIKQLQGEIKSISRRLKELEETEEKVYVPKEIGLADENDSDGSAFIVNDLGQSLWRPKPSTFKSFSTGSRNNENTGDNYYLKKVEKPEAGKAYFVTDCEALYNVDSLFQYRIFLNEKTQCCWNKLNEYYSASVNISEWDYYYEIVKEDK